MVPARPPARRADVKGVVLDVVEDDIVRCGYGRRDGEKERRGRIVRIR